MTARHIVGTLTTDFQAALGETAEPGNNGSGFIQPTAAGPMATGLTAGGTAPAAVAYTEEGGSKAQLLIQPAGDHNDILITAASIGGAVNYTTVSFIDRRAEGNFTTAEYDPVKQTYAFTDDSL